MRRSHALEALNQTKYEVGANIQDHLKLLRARRVAMDNLSNAPMSDAEWRGVIIRSLPTTPKWLPVIPSLYLMTTSGDIVSTLLSHGIILGRDSKSKTTTSTSTALAARATEGCTNPNCKAKKRSTHTTSNCYWPGGGKEGQFPPNFGQRSKANAATTNVTPDSVPNLTAPGQNDTFVLSARVPTISGRSGILIEGLIPEQSGLVINDGLMDDLPCTALISKGFQTLGKG